MMKTIDMKKTSPKILQQKKTTPLIFSPFHSSLPRICMKISISLLDTEKNMWIVNEAGLFACYVTVQEFEIKSRPSNFFVVQASALFEWNFFHNKSKEFLILFD